ncbi:metal ABC transporter permease [Nesterenkonia natronophila]|uniref:Metal ABC transporter permease n=1 Tax=Nesterenkonia natronophila TaxID=2174932 RepID=A0A3A4F5P2_9MICC|nr:metal ABC transporter permease [Nesterenkonia natronophila]RJN33056.1 metal ABC transporter permease [Nesterenkonia natronophila]
MIDLLVTPLQYPFMQNALAVAVISAAVCGMLSAWLVLMGWSLMGEAVAHSILPGVVLAFIVGVPLGIGAFIFGLAAVALIGILGQTTALKRDTTIGVVFTSLFALGLVLMSTVTTQTHLQHILFGNVLGTSRADLYQVAALGTVTAAVLLLKRRDFTLLAFDRTYARAIGLPVGALTGVLLALLALTTVTALQTLGVILVVAALVIPGATAFLVVRSFGAMLALSAGVGAVAAVAGVYASYWWDVSTGGAIVLAATAQFALAYFLSPRRGVIAQAWRRRRPSDAVAV